MGPGRSFKLAPAISPFLAPASRRIRLHRLSNILRGNYSWNGNEMQHTWCFLSYRCSSHSSHSRKKCSHTPRGFFPLFSFSLSPLSTSFPPSTGLGQREGWKEDLCLSSSPCLKHRRSRPLLDDASLSICVPWENARRSLHQFTAPSLRPTKESRVDMRYS